MRPHADTCTCVACLMLGGEDVPCDAPGCVANKGHRGGHVRVRDVFRRAVADGLGWLAAKVRGRT